MYRSLVLLSKFLHAIEKLADIAASTAGNASCRADDKAYNVAVSNNVANLRAATDAATRAQAALKRAENRYYAEAARIKEAHDAV